jgi:ABC-type lipoprotein export system ATPase subunit
MKRTEIQERLAKAMNATERPAALFCIERFEAVEQDGGDRLGRLLARLIRDPEHAFIVATTNAFVFAFDDQVGRREDVPTRENLATRAMPQTSK